MRVLLVLLFALFLSTAVGLKCYFCSNDDPMCSMKLDESQLKTKDKQGNDCKTCGSLTVPILLPNAVKPAQITDRYCTTDKSSNSCVEKNEKGTTVKICQCDTDACNGVKAQSKLLSCYHCMPTKADNCKKPKESQLATIEKITRRFMCTVCTSWTMKNGEGVARGCRNGGPPAKNCKDSVILGQGGTVCECGTKACNSAVVGIKMPAWFFLTIAMLKAFIY